MVADNAEVVVAAAGAMAAWVGAAKCRGAKPKVGGGKFSLFSESILLVVFFWVIISKCARWNSYNPIPNLAMCWNNWKEGSQVKIWLWI